MSKKKKNKKLSAADKKKKRLDDMIVTFYLLQARLQSELSQLHEYARWEKQNLLEANTLLFDLEDKIISLNQEDPILEVDEGES